MAITGTIDTVEQVLQALRSNEDDRRHLEKRLAEIMLAGGKL